MDAGKKILLDLFTGSLRFASVRGSGVSAPILMGRSTVPAIVGRHRNGWQAS